MHTKAPAVRRIADKPGQVPGLNGSDSRRRKGAIPGAENQGKHPEVWPHLPLVLYRPRLPEKQGACPALIPAAAPPSPRFCFCCVAVRDGCVRGMSGCVRGMMGVCVV